MRPFRRLAAWMLFLWMWAAPAYGLEAELAAGQTPRFWRLAAQAQAALEQRHVIVQDTYLTSFLQAVAERLWEQVPSDFSTPTVNVIMETGVDAFTYPNGYCVLSTGILDQMENEDQLAMVLAHEMVHYYRQHSVVLYNHLQKPAVRSGILQADQGRAAGGGAIKESIDAAEIQADMEGLSIMKRAGYCQAEVLTLMANLAKRMRDQGQTGKMKQLEKRISMIKTTHHQDHNRPACTSTTDESHTSFLNCIAPALKANAQAALQCGNWKQADQSVSKFLDLKPDDAGAYYLKGEILRRRNIGDGKKQCIESYLKALSIDPQFPLAHRAMGEVHFKAGRYRAARPFFEAFLSLAPQDHTGEFIKGYLRQCQN